MGRIGRGRNNHTQSSSALDQLDSGNELESGKYHETLIDKRRNRRGVSRSGATGVRSLALLVTGIIALFSPWAGGTSTAAAAALAPDQANSDVASRASITHKSNFFGQVESTEAITNLQVTLDPMETLLGPTWKLDTQFSTIGRTPNVIGYVSNKSVWAYSTSDLFNLAPLPGMALVEGTPGSFDGCGAWLNSTYQDGAVLRGWYHAEANANCANNPAFKSVGYAESYDGGLTFVKPSYPSNQVISAPARFTDPEQASEGDHRVIQIGEYLYMYFVAPRDSYKIHLARSLVSDGGKPGTWWKYYNGSFSQPGLGGESNSIASGTVLGRAWVSYNAAVGEYMGFSWSPTGFGISLSPDGINWRRVTGDILLTNHEYHDRGPTSGELIDYASFIGLDGNPDVTDTESWVYFMWVPAGQPMVGDTRYLARRKMHILNGVSATPTVASTTTPTASSTATSTSTLAPSATATSTPSSTSTATGTRTSTYTPSNTPTQTTIATSSSTSTSTATAISTRTATRTSTYTPLATDTSTRTPTLNPTATSTLTRMPSSTPVSTSTALRTVTALSTATLRPVITSTLTFLPQIDARVEAANPNTNYGIGTYLFSIGGREPHVDSYLRFTVSGVAGTIQSAKLRVYCFNGTTNGPAIYATNSNWSETGVTWNNRPPRSGPAYDDKGALPANSWVEFNITPMVRGSGTYNFIMTQKSVDGFYVYSREGLIPPQLVVTFANPQR